MIYCKEKEVVQQLNTWYNTYQLWLKMAAPGSQSRIQPEVDLIIGHNCYIIHWRNKYPGILCSKGMFNRIKNSVPASRLSTIEPTDKVFGSFNFHIDELSNIERKLLLDDMLQCL